MAWHVTAGFSAEGPGASMHRASHDTFLSPVPRTDSSACGHCVKQITRLYPKPRAELTKRKPRDCFRVPRVDSSPRGLSLAPKRAKALLWHGSCAALQLLVALLRAVLRISEDSEGVEFLEPCYLESKAALDIQNIL